MIYFIREKDNPKSLIKIGFTDDIEQRLAQIQSSSPVDLEILAIIADGDKNTEAEIHYQFDEYRVRGEWFKPARKLLVFLDKIASTRKKFMPFFTLKLSKFILQVGTEAIVADPVQVQAAYSVLSIADTDIVIVGGEQVVVKDRHMFLDYARRIVAGETLAINNWTGGNKPFARGEYESLLIQLRNYGLVCIQPGQTGNVLTRNGLDALNEYIQSIP